MTTLNEASLQLLGQKLWSGEQLQFIVLGDSHLNSYGWNGHTEQYDLDDNGKRYKKILKHIVKHYGSSASFVVHGGDTIGEGVIKGVGRVKSKEANFQAFTAVTKDILFPKQLPIFVTIGNHDMLEENSELSTRLFETYIGPVKGEIIVPGSNAAYMYLPTYFHSSMGAPYFKEEDLKWMQEKLQTYSSDYYFIDFHAALRVEGLKQKENDQHSFLSDAETNKLLGHLNKNVLGIFNHHRHTSYKKTISLPGAHLKHTISYLVTGCGGNDTSTPNCPHYFVCTVDQLHSEKPTVALTPVIVPKLS